MLLGDLISAAGVIFAVFLAASLGTRAYRQQKNLDRKQEEYRKYVAAFQAANFWNVKGDEPKHRESEVRYREAHECMLLIASKDVVDAVSSFHHCYLSSIPLQQKEEELKDKYSQMIEAMREDGFESDITAQEIKERITWDV
jgi:hypothetical protein